MADISKEIKDFKDAVYGEEVRGAMISLAEKLNKETTHAESTAQKMEEEESARDAAEKARVAAEEKRAEAEGKREKAENNRASAERTRTEAESERIEAETERGEAEAARKEEESARDAAETARAVAEGNRASAEKARKTAEEGRTTAETARAEAESSRATAEAARNNAESKRNDAEKKRATAETARSEAESSRATAETARIREESSRATAEAAREKAESERERKTNEALSGVVTASQTLQEQIQNAKKAEGTLESDIETARTLLSGMETEAEDAAASAQRAAESATASATSADAAQKSATGAATSASDAAGYQAEAKLSETKAQESQTAAKMSETKAADSQAAAKLSETNAKESQTAAAGSESKAAQSATASADSATNAKKEADRAETAAQSVEDMAREAESYARGGTGARAGEETDNARFYADLAARTVEAATSGALIPMGTITFSQLPTEGMDRGQMYNISDDFESDERFEFPAIKYSRGSNVYYTAKETWDVLAGVVVTGVKGEAENTFHRGDAIITRKGLGLENVPNVGTNDQTPTFTVATNRENIKTGEKLAVILGKIAKWFSDLKTVAFTGKYSDLTGTPASLKNPHALTFTGGSDAVYDGSAAKSVKIPNAPEDVGALAADGKAKTAGAADTAAKLATARTFPAVNLAGSGTATFDGSANPSALGVTGILPVANGGTGQTTAQKAAETLLAGLAESEDASTLDTNHLIVQGGTGYESRYYRKKTSTVFEWIKGKLAKVASTGSYTDLSNKPTALKNPNSITFWGRTEYLEDKLVYDGQAGKFLNIPATLVGSVAVDATDAAQTVLLCRQFAGDAGNANVEIVKSVYLLLAYGGPVGTVTSGKYPKADYYKASLLFPSFTPNAEGTKAEAITRKEVAIGTVGSTARFKFVSAPITIEITVNKGSMVYAFAYMISGGSKEECLS